MHLKKIIIITVTALVFFVIFMAVNIIVTVKNESVVSSGHSAKTVGNNCALLIIDIQEVITGNHSIYPALQKNSDRLIRNINQIADTFKNYDYPVIYIRSEIKNPFINLLNNSYAKGSPGVLFDKRLKIVSYLEVIKTGKDSFRKTDLDEILAKKKVNNLYIVGLDAAECVNATIQAAQNREYKVNIIKEAVISKTEKSMDSMILSFQNRGVEIKEMNNLSLPKR